MVGMATSTCPRVSPASLVTLPLIVSGSWARAPAVTRTASATVVKRSRTERVMRPPALKGGNGLHQSCDATERGGTLLRICDEWREPRDRRAARRDEED